MYLIVGLGNPGSRYEFTRHNIGFQILDRFAQKNGLRFKSSKKDYYYSEGVINSSDFFLVKPVSYMNMSGVPLLDFLEDHSVDITDILVLADDVNLAVGDIRLRKSGSDGGHNGIKSIIYHLQNDSFPRLRFGIGNEFEKGEMADFVLSEFRKDEYDLIDKGIGFSLELIENFVSGGYKSMLDFYSKSKARLSSESDDSTLKNGKND